MGNVVIVAIPKKDDYVWNISSEKVPHMTLLNLGNALSDEDVARVMGYIEHAASTSLSRFGLPVDRRGTLGKDDADVVFFTPDAWDLRSVQKFRTFLLREDKIHTAVDLTPQFENWAPHLTLGYPTAPAKPDPRENHGIHYVDFDRVALWVDDFAGPEFELKSRWSDHEVMMSTLTSDTSVDHSGVKGMKWGVRKDERGHGLSMFMIKNGASKADIHGVKRAFARVAGTARVGVAMTNRRYKGVDLTKNAKLRKKYEGEVTEVMNRGINSGLKNTLANVGTAVGIVGLAATAPASVPAGLAAGTLSMGYRLYTMGQQVGEGVRVYDKGVVKHADEGAIIPIIFEYDDNGLIKSLRLDGIPEDGPIEVEHAIDLEDPEAVEHVGVKGMKWGVRRTREQRAAARKELADRHDDHTKARELMKKKVSTLSNEELAFVNQRRQLEANYSKLNPAKAARRKKKIENHLDTLGLLEKTFKATQQPVAQLAIKKAATKANSKAAKKILKVLIAVPKGP